jgi:hypothetical protein
MMNEVEERLLFELANLHDNGVFRFLEGPYLKSEATAAWKALFVRETESSILEARNELRELWDASTPAARKEEILTGWLRKGPAESARFLVHRNRTSERPFRAVPQSRLPRSLLSGETEKPKVL